VVDSCECGNEPQSSINAGNVTCFLPGRAKDLSAPLYLYGRGFHSVDELKSR